jgi:hypothetical protein
MVRILHTLQLFKRSFFFSLDHIRVWSSFLTTVRNNYWPKNKKIRVLRLKNHFTSQNGMVCIQQTDDLWKILLCSSWYSFWAGRDTVRQISCYPLHVISSRTLYVGFDSAMNARTFRKHFATSKPGIVVLLPVPQNHHLTQRRAIEPTSAVSDSRRPSKVSPISLGFMACVYN